MERQFTIDDLEDGDILVSETGVRSIWFQGYMHNYSRKLKLNKDLTDATENAYGEQIFKEKFITEIIRNGKIIYTLKYEKTTLQIKLEEMKITVSELNRQILELEKEV